MTEEWKELPKTISGKIRHDRVEWAEEARQASRT